MSAKATIVHQKDTGHILAAFTRVDATQPNLTEGLLPNELLVRLLDGTEFDSGSDDPDKKEFAELEFHIPSAELAIQEVAPPSRAELTDPKTRLIPNLLRHPRAFRVDDPTKPNSGVSPIPTTGPGVDPSKTKFDGKTLEVAFMGIPENGVAQATKAWAVVEHTDTRGQRQTHVARAEVPLYAKGVMMALDVRLPAASDPTYPALVLIGGMRPFATKFKATLS